MSNSLRRMPALRQVPRRLSKSTSQADATEASTLGRKQAIDAGIQVLRRVVERAATMHAYFVRNLQAMRIESRMLREER